MDALRAVLHEEEVAEVDTELADYVVEAARLAVEEGEGESELEELADSLGLYISALEADETRRMDVARALCQHLRQQQQEEAEREEERRREQQERRRAERARLQRQQQQQLGSAEEQAEELQFLSGLAPDLEVAVVRYVLEVVCGNKQSQAAEHLLQLDEEARARLRAQSQEWEENRAAQLEADRRHRAEAKAGIVARHLVVEEELVPPPVGSSGGGSAAGGAGRRKKAAAQRPPPIGVVLLGEHQKNSNTRYLNSEVVTRRGEKYVDVNVEEEYDGGSRGRVKTKGKRGKGWR